MTELLIWRHGQTQWNSIRRLQGQTDVDLDDVGVAQAAESAPRLAARTPAIIVSSDLARAASTAAALAALTGLPVELDARLRERDYGPWEGLTSAQIRTLDPDAFTRWGSRHEGELPGIETLDELGKRAAAAFADAAERADGGTAVVVSHGGAARAGCATLLGWPAEVGQAMRILRNCHVTELGHQPDRGWQLYAHNVR
jgi:broad specificity phosphatase PhoE